MKNSWFRQWDEGNYNLDSKIFNESNKKEINESDNNWEKEYLKGVENKERRAFFKSSTFITLFFTLLLIVLFFVVIYYMPSFGDPSSPANSSEVIKRYIENGLDETGAINIVAGVILDYRAFDTLGESHVLFTAALVVTLLLIEKKSKKENKQEEDVLIKDEVLRNTTKVLFPLILMLGLYVIFTGHLGPGGGFSGGAIIGAALILYSLSYGSEKLEKLITFKRYKIITVIALGFYSLSKCYSFYCGANGLETIFTNGTPGMIFSAGLILPLNIAVGIVVALTMYGFYSYFTRGHI